MDVYNAKTARELIRSWSGHSPKRRIWVFEYAASGQSQNAQISLEQRNPRAAADYIKAANVLLREAAMLRRSASYRRSVRDTDAST